MAFLKSILEGNFLALMGALPLNWIYLYYCSCWSVEKVHASDAGLTHFSCLFCFR